ncbi:T9SS type A sorting domain-containing protein [Dyadobacter sp. CY351]|uniref:T9SS type A sorting domain-containing protein n=1 Tax=Dyadobacter sp. CY351 TaxID=2909337 RepID=UPI001F3AA032|nr:T9SS type A sorting domain-containing protein [Dyadobacter sp. CY351]MCF2518261.1 T9SS type A sorting domain-containing protein [Dyadobacter sp. CY351]
MKPVLLISAQFCFFIFALSTQALAGTCRFTELRLNSQSAVNNFDASCTSVIGNISIAGADITDLAPLAGVETIDGTLTIQNNTILPNLKQLANLTSTKNLLIYNNDLLTDLSGLEGLTSNSGSIHIRFHKNLTSLTGLNNLATARIFYITDNALLENLDGLASLTTITDVLMISLNKSLVNLEGLDNLSNVSRILIGENDLLKDLTGLSSLTSVSYQMHVSSNKSLTSLSGLPASISMSELYISDNNLLTDLTGLQSIGYVYWLVISDSKGLGSLNGLNNLNSATNFIIRNNPLLTDLSGLDNLTDIGWIQITGNAELKSLDGLGAGEQSNSETGRISASLAIGGLAITNNPKLTMCAIEPVCIFIRQSTASISGNGIGCESQAAVQSSCGSLPVRLAHFTATGENQQAILKWTTTDESNSSTFEIERSLDAKAWLKIGEHAAKGESTQLVNYQWADIHPLDGLNYYRLKMVDRDGTYSYSQKHMLRFELNQASTFVYPNPVSDFLFVKNASNITWLSITDLHGRIIFETKKVPNEGLSIEKIATGLYHVQITTQEGEVKTESIAIY